MKRLPPLLWRPVRGAPRPLDDELGERAGLVLFGFDRDQSERARGWIPFLRSTAELWPGLSAHVAPVLPSTTAPWVRALVEGGLRFGLAKPDATLVRVLYADRDALLDALSVHDAGDLVLALVGGRDLAEPGLVLSVFRGAFSPALAPLVEAALDEHVGGLG